MPPRDSSEPAAPAMASIAGVMARHSRDEVARCGSTRGSARVEPVDVGEQHQAVGADHRGDARGEPVVVAVADLVGRHRVVLVDDRDRAERRAASPASRARSDSAGAPRCRSSVSRTCAAVSPCSRRHSSQACASAICPTAAAAWLSSSFSAPRVQAEHAAAERDRAGRDDEHVACRARAVRRCRRRARPASRG